jgi:hypothetical protein
MLDSFTSSFVDQSKCGITFLVLNLGAVPHVLDPVLEWITGVCWSEHDLAITGGKTIVLTRSAKDLNGRWSLDIGGRRCLVGGAMVSVAKEVVSFHGRW